MCVRNTIEEGIHISNFISTEYIHSFTQLFKWQFIYMTSLLFLNGNRTKGDVLRSGHSMIYYSGS